MTTAADQQKQTQTQTDTRSEFVERRTGRRSPSGFERRQFGNTHQSLSMEARELAEAIDNYKLENHRRYITYEEMLKVINQLGYRKD